MPKSMVSIVTTIRRRKNIYYQLIVFFIGYIHNGIYYYKQRGLSYEEAEPKDDEDKKDNDKKGLDNSDKKDKINSVNKKEGDNDGKQQQSNSELKRQAIGKLRKWLDSGRPNGIMSVFDKRRGGGRLGDGLVENTIEAKPETKAIFQEGGIPTPIFNQLKKNDKKAIDTFKNALSKVKQSLGNKGASVELKDDYKDINLYLSEDGESGFAIKPDGDIISVFSSRKERGRAHYMLEIAIEEGGKKLDCFDIYLTKIYALHGFKAVARTKWNEEYKPEDWNKETFKNYNNGEPDVVYMVYDAEQKSDYKAGDGKLVDTYEEAVKEQGHN